MDRKALEKIMFEKKLDVIISLSQQTRLWFTKINTSAGHLFIEKEIATLLIDGRYIEYAQEKAKNTIVKLLNRKSYKDFISTKKYSKIGIEEEYITYSELENLKKDFPNSEFIPISAQRLRIIKSKEEIVLMQKAADIAMDALEKLKSDIKPGISEKELDAKLEMYLRQFGAEKGSFDAIVASGARSSLPHGRASEKILQDGELITIDFGAYYKGYASDITRTFHVGNVTNHKLLEIETILREAQKLGRDAVKPGITTFEIDKICRDYITEKGYGEYFVHSTGHGLGVDVHELPIVSYIEKLNTTLEPGMVITVEPGIYLPDIGGIRVEDDMVVTENGNINLSRTKYDY